MWYNDSAVPQLLMPMLLLRFLSPKLPQEIGQVTEFVNHQKSLIGKLRLFEGFSTIVVSSDCKEDASLVESEGGKLVVKVVVKLLPETVSIKGWHYCAICVLMHTELKVIFWSIKYFSRLLILNV